MPLGCEHLFEGRSDRFRLSDLDTWPRKMVNDELAFREKYPRGHPVRVARDNYLYGPQAPSSSRGGGSLEAGSSHTTQLKRDESRYLTASSSGSGPLNMQSNLRTTTELNRDEPIASDSRTSRPDDRTHLYRDSPASSSTSKVPTSTPGRDSEKDYDEYMKTRQTRYNELSLEEQKTQDKWSRSRLEKRMPGACSAGSKWTRIRSGYICGAAYHYMTDELLV